MDAEEFRKRGKEMVDRAADYLENIRDRRVLPAVQPGYLHGMIPDHAPEVPERWEDLMADIERVIMPGVTHWHSPHFHAYFPTANSYPAICADILSDAIGCVGFSWISSPACTELEVVMTDWLVKMLNLPQEFLSGGKGGGVIQASGSEGVLLPMLSARNKMLNQQKDENEGKDDYGIIGRLVAYCSDQAHTCVERAGLLAALRVKTVESDAKCRMRGDALSAAIIRDKQQGLIPFYVVATLGTTSSCAFDNLMEIGPVCRREGIWLNVDAAYAGSAFVCPEFRHLMAGIEFADSFSFSPHKWMLVNNDCSVLWFKDSSHFVDDFRVDLELAKHDQQEKAIDFRHWQIPFGRRFRSLKLWFTLRMYGVTGIQEHIRKQVALAKDFETLVKADKRFEVTNDVIMGLVCFRLKGVSNEINERLLRRINQDGRIHMVASTGKGVYYLRFAVCANKTQSDDIHFAWGVITEISSKVMREQGLDDRKCHL